MLLKFVIANINDILIYLPSLEAHVHHIKCILVHLLNNQLYVNREKYEFHASNICFFGYIIGPEGVAVDQENVATVTEWPTPKTMKELQRFLGFTNFYRRFIQGFISIMTPFTSILKMGPNHLVWNTEANEVFEKLKTAYTTTPILKHPDLSKPFIVDVDATEPEVGAVLSGD